MQVSASPSFSWDRQDVLFSTADYLRGADHPQYDVSPDDQRFVMERIEGAADTELILVANWFEELMERGRRIEPPRASADEARFRILCIPSEPERTVRR